MRIALRYLGMMILIALNGSTVQSCKTTEPQRGGSSYSLSSINFNTPAREFFGKDKPVEKLKNIQFSIIGQSPQGKKLSICNSNRRQTLVVGSGQTIKETVYQNCDYQLSLYVYGENSYPFFHGEKTILSTELIGKKEFTASLVINLTEAGIQAGFGSIVAGESKSIDVTVGEAPPAVLPEPADTTDLSVDTSIGKDTFDATPNVKVKTITAGKMEYNVSLDYIATVKATYEFTAQGLPALTDSSSIECKIMVEITSRGGTRESTVAEEESFRFVPTKAISEQSHVVLNNQGSELLKANVKIKSCFGQVKY